MLRLSQVALENGWIVLSVNHRGCGKGIELPCRKPYHSGGGDDISEVLLWSRANFPNLLQVSMGFSLGGSALLNLITGHRGVCQPDVAFVVNAPLDVKRAATSLDQGMNRIYSSNFRTECYWTLEEKKRRGWLQEIPNKNLIRKFSDLDRYHTAPVLGFKTTDDFYDSCSTKNRLLKIKTPSLILTAWDDPIAHPEDYLNEKRSAQLAIHMEKVGGHIGYISTTRPSKSKPLSSAAKADNTWLERCLLHYLEQVPEIFKKTSLKKSLTKKGRSKKGLSAARKSAGFTQKPKRQLSLRKNSIVRGKKSQNAPGTINSLSRRASKTKRILNSSSNV